MFRASSAHLQEDTVVHMQRMVVSFSMRVPGGLSVHIKLKLYKNNAAIWFNKTCKSSHSSCVPTGHQELP